jgi:hypothetical protein
MDGKWCKVAILAGSSIQQPDTWVHTPRESRHDVAARCLHRPPCRAFAPTIESVRRAIFGCLLTISRLNRRTSMRPTRQGP